MIVLYIIFSLAIGLYMSGRELWKSIEAYIFNPRFRHLGQLEEVLEGLFQVIMVALIWPLIVCFLLWTLIVFIYNKLTKKG